MASKLPHYLKTHRKRSGLSQEEVAFLLGNDNGEKVCRHERFAREPSLRSALAYLIIFQGQAEELFAGIHEEVKREVITRAKKLARRRKESPTGKPEALKRILGDKIKTSSSKINGNKQHNK
jgi:hypothetical protein